MTSQFMNVKKSSLPRMLLLLSVTMGITPYSFSQDRRETRVLMAQASQEGVEVDGLLNEEVWSRAQPAEPFRQKEPVEGQEASEETIVRAVYTPTRLILGIVCRDSSPDQIVATELRRDGDLLKDDSIWVLIDSFHDHRNAFLFATNPLATQYDALIINEGEEINDGWDEVWDVATSRDDQGWSAEIEIPFEAVRLRKANTEIGLELRRVLRRKNEFVFWNSWERDFKFEAVSQAGHLRGLEDVETQALRRLKAYVLGGTGQTGEEGWDNRSEVGIDDFKWRFTPTLTADLTYNTDFAEVELDAAQSNFSSPRSQLFFPEKREFFLEGAGFFDVSVKMAEQPGSTEFRSLFTRKIGLSNTGQRIPLLGGGKVTGRMGGLSIGALEIVSEAEGERDNNSYTVLRLQHDLFSRSSVGGIVTDRSGDGTFSRMTGMDMRLILLENFSLESFFARSDNTGVTGDQDAYYAKAYWKTDLWDIGAGHVTLEPGFDSDLAFMSRRDSRKNIFDVAFKPRPGISWIRQINLRYFGEYYTDNDNVLSEKTNHYPIIVFLENGDQMRFGPHNRFHRLFRPLTLFPGIVVPPGDYNGGSMSFTYTVDPSRPLSGALEVLYFWGYFGGSRSVLETTGQWKPTPAVILDIATEHNYVRLPQGDFNAHLINFGLNYSLSTTLTTSTVLRYSNQTRVKALNFRLNYIYRPGDDLFVVYRDTRNDLNPDLSDRAILVKFTHSFNF